MDNKVRLSEVGLWSVIDEKTRAKIDSDIAEQLCGLPVLRQKYLWHEARSLTNNHLGMCRESIPPFFLWQQITRWNEFLSWDEWDAVYDRVREGMRGLYDLRKAETFIEKAISLPEEAEPTQMSEQGIWACINEERRDIIDTHTRYDSDRSLVMAHEPHDLGRHLLDTLIGIPGISDNFIYSRHNRHPYLSREHFDRLRQLTYSAALGVTNLRQAEFYVELFAERRRSKREKV